MAQKMAEPTVADWSHQDQGLYQALFIFRCDFLKTVERLYLSMQDWYPEWSWVLAPFLIKKEVKSTSSLKRVQEDESDRTHTFTQQISAGSIPQKQDTTRSALMSPQQRCCGCYKWKLRECLWSTWLDLFCFVCSINNNQDITVRDGHKNNRTV